MQLPREGGAGRARLDLAVASDRAIADRDVAGLVAMAILVLHVQAQMLAEHVVSANRDFVFGQGPGHLGAGGVGTRGLTVEVADASDPGADNIGGAYDVGQRVAGAARLEGIIPTAAVFDSCGIPNIRMM